MSRARYWMRSEEGTFMPATGIPLSDRGFRYGMAIFETIGVRAGRPLFLAEHLRSAADACRATGLRVDARWLDQAADFSVQMLVCEGGTGVMRLHVTAGDGAPDAPADACRLILAFEERRPLEVEDYGRGYRLVSVRPTGRSSFAAFKTHNYWPNTAGLTTARALGGDEGLIFDEEGSLLSACMANVFVLTAAGALLTPPAGPGTRAGVVRQWVLARRNVRQSRIGRTDLHAIKEAFLTSSWLGIMPVTKIDGAELPVSSVSKILMSEYHCQLDIDTADATNGGPHRG